MLPSGIASQLADIRTLSCTNFYSKVSNDYNFEINLRMWRWGEVRRVSIRQHHARIRSKISRVSNQCQAGGSSKGRTVDPPQDQEGPTGTSCPKATRKSVIHSIFPQKQSQLPMLEQEPQDRPSQSLLEFWFKPQNSSCLGHWFKILKWLHSRSH